MKPRRVLPTSLLLTASLLVGSVLSPTSAIAAPSEDALEKAACSLTPAELLATYRGHRDDRGGDLMAIPREPNIVGGGLPHAGPWPYLQEVPLLFWGPGTIKARGSVSTPVTSADIAPTEGAILDFEFTTPNGQVLEQVLEPPGKRKSPPKLLVTLVWDSAGRDVLDEWPKEWPYLQSLIKQGTWFENATIGSSPSDTPPIHATIGTGWFPQGHGEIDQVQRLGGNLITPWSQGPTLLLRPTLADLYDLHMDNKPIVGAFASLRAHLGMLGHGAMWGGGDKDIAVNRESLTDDGDEAEEWSLRENLKVYYEFPNYVTKLPPVGKYKDPVDQSDGAMDGAWLGTPFSELRDGWDTPARVPYQTDAIEAMVKKERFGKDDVPDLLFLNYKTIDNIGHKFSLNSPEMRDTVKAQDDGLKGLVSFFNQKVGVGEWVLVLTADHGAQRDPAITGAHPVSPRVLEEKIEGKFGPIIKGIRPTMVWLNAGAMNDGNVTEAEVSEYMLSLSEAELPDPEDPGGPEKMYQAVFPSSMFKKLSCFQKALRAESRAVAAWNKAMDEAAEGSQAGGDEGPADEAPPGPRDAERDRPSPAAGADGDTKEPVYPP